MWLHDVTAWRDDDVATYHDDVIAIIAVVTLITVIDAAATVTVTIVTFAIIVIIIILCKQFFWLYFIDYS